MLLGEDFFPLMVLAFGAAAVVGTVGGILREGDFAKAPAIVKLRSSSLIAVGAVMCVWAVATLAA